MEAQSTGGAEAGTAIAPADVAAVDSGSHDATEVQEAAPSPRAPEARGADLVVRTALGLVLLVVLVWLASHPRVRRIEERLGVRQLLAAGFAFVALGVIARHPAVGVLSDGVLEDLTPVLHFALGWLGLVIGLQLDVRMLDSLPRESTFTVATEAVAPFVVVTAGGALTLLAFGEPWQDPRFLRHAIALGAAGAVCVTAVRERPGPWRPGEPSELAVARADSLDEIVGVIALAMVGAFFRPSWVEWRWELPGTVWLFVTLGMGAAVGLLVWAMARERTSSAEFLALVVGAVALASGMAGYVFLSPMVICFCVGAVMANFPMEERERLAQVVTAVERPLYYVLLTIGGALWDLRDPRGWALVGVFLACRFGGAVVARAVLERAARGAGTFGAPGPLLRPISPISIAIVLSLLTMYRGAPIGWIVTAVLGGAILTEGLLHLRDALRPRGGSR